VTQALAGAVGVDARTSGANSSVTIRGFSAGDTLILFDGLPRPVKYGIANLNLFGVEAVERIEVVRGPMSALYGANASGGVINVITRAPGEGPDATVALTWTGTDDGERSGLTLASSFQLTTGSVAHRVSFDVRSADAFKFDPAAANSDLSGIQHFTGTYAGRADLGADRRLRWEIEVFSQRDQGEGFLAPTPPARPVGTPYDRFERETRWFGKLGYTAPLGGGQLSLDASASTSDGSTNRSFPTIETTDFDQALVQGRYGVDLGPHALLMGAGLQRDDLAVSINSRTATRDNWHVFIQDEWTLGAGFKLNAGVRYDDFTLFGGSTNPRLSLGWNGSNGLFARAGYGTAFRAPTAIENYSRFTRGRFIILGSETLLPEETETSEVAAGWRGRLGGIEVVGHRSDVTNLIETFSPGGTLNGLIISAYRNRATADLSGVEISGRVRPVAGVDLEASWEELTAEDGVTGARLNNRYRNAVRASLTWQAGPVELVLRHRALLGLWGPNPAIRGSAPFASDYATTDVVARWQVTEAASVTLGISNITDELTPVNYSSTGSIEDPPGRNVFLTLRGAF
jgi:outer membrane receptor for ferrienterochelin and colicin